MKKMYPILLCVAVLVTQDLSAQTAVGYDFLRTLVGARPSAMGGAFVAVPGDIHNIAYNPAGLSTIQNQHGTLSYLNHLLDFQSGFLAYAHPFANATGAVALNFIDFGSFDGRNEDNEPTGDFGANGLVLSATYAKSILENLSLGGSAKYIRFQIDNFTETAVAFDGGVMVSFPQKQLNLGLAVFNLGSTTSAFIDTKDELPLSAQLGFSKVLEHLPIMLSASLIKYKEESLDFRVGGEITLTEQLFARLGYNSTGQDQKVDTDNDKFAGLSMGLGFKINKFNIDYSFSSFGEVGGLNRFSIIGRF